MAAFLLAITMLSSLVLATVALWRLGNAGVPDSERKRAETIRKFALTTRPRRPAL